MELINEQGLHDAVAQYVFDECELLDSQQFEAWLDLFTAQGLYWVPLRHNQESPENGFSLVNENVDLLRMRIARMQHPTAHGMEVPIWTSRVVGNVRILNATDDLVEATARFCLVESENDRQRIFAGKYHYRLRKTDTFQIERKRVDLVNCESPFASIQIIL